MNTQRPKSQRPTIYFMCALALWGVALLSGCHALSKVEREMCQQSPEALCTGAVKAYKSRDLDAFTDLAISRKQLGEMMNGAKLPSTAKRESISNLSGRDFAKMVQDSLGTVLTKCGVDWPKARFEKFTPSRNPVEIAEGYKMILGKLYILVGDNRFVQSVTLVEAGKGKYFMGDFSEITVEK